MHVKNASGKSQKVYTNVNCKKERLQDYSNQMQLEASMHCSYSNVNHNNQKLIIWILSGTCNLYYKGSQIFTGQSFSELAIRFLM